VDGRCPPKPRSQRKERTPAVRQYKSVDAAAKQAGEVLRSQKASREQKKEAVKVLGSAVAGETVKKVATEVKREAKAAARTPAGKAAIAAAKKAAVKAAKAAGGATLAGAVVYGAVKGIEATRAKEAKAYAKAQLAQTKKNLPKGALTPAQEAVLLKQYEDYHKKKPVTNPYLGK
jgi:hypothetical protein